MTVSRIWRWRGRYRSKDNSEVLVKFDEEVRSEVTDRTINQGRLHLKDGERGRERKES